MRSPVAREGYIFIVISFVPVIITYHYSAWWLFAFFFSLFVFVVAFFRDPEREIPEGREFIVCPADGKVIRVETTFDERFLNKEVEKICIFMNVFNVHVNRAPASGTIKDIVYNKGRFFSADSDKASLENEQNALFIEADNGEMFVTNQIAGLVARRIVCWPKPGDKAVKGRRFGLIRFGSRVDVYLPVGTKIEVEVGQKVSAGSTILARWAPAVGK